jgi:hypothetical protein
MPQQVILSPVLWVEGQQGGLRPRDQWGNAGGFRWCISRAHRAIRSWLDSSGSFSGFASFGSLAPPVLNVGDPEW